ncbi:cell division protein FtsK/SpoIIIE [Pseudonocardia dioxanivorans CB1190]|uniref:Cell division protein FtsK/SpoIIIE n=1 Tax=Pseudonocardia dioxanivorans (strain ATCC 55486 / DSM 44775 / JCM 13855 / CB1190) TaxID=675635 RepID=F4CSD6_PSEUX|nr:DNA translocase FtsK [Pseudonocardia dioxanivorans]AEA23110.1 cell division protein FtsK/SpoIIIE [Pseudonocardia dioxanivorans CB1190]
MSAVPYEPVADPQPVDQIREPRRTAFDRITAHREAAKHPIVVPWVRDRDQRDPILRWAAGYSWHVARFHAVRLPVYVLRVLRRSPVGLGRAIRWVVDGMTDSEARPLRKSAVVRDDVREYMQLARERNARVRHRAVAAVVGGVLVAAFLVWLLLVATGPLFWAGLAAAVAVLGVIGRDREKPLITRATTPLHLAPVLRADVVEVALRALPGVVKKDARIEFPDPVTRDGPGYLARVNLPVGVTPQDVMGKRAALASGLRRPIGCVWPAPGPHHGGQLDLWVGDQDLATARQPVYPLLEKGVADVFGRLPYGTNQRNGKVGVQLIENNALIGAMVGQGKTSAMRVLALGCALDVTAELRVWELKGSGDLGALEQLAHTYGSGQDDETIRGCLEDLRAIRAEVERRAGEIKKIAKRSPEMCPNNKVTRDLANRRDLGLHPMVVLLDEVQNLFSHETYGKEAGKLALDIIRLGRAFGVMLVQATQRPDADSLPKGISSNAGIRIALRVMDDYANNAILGAGMYAAGIRATDFTVRDKGIAWLVGVEDEPLVAKSFNITTGMAERVCERARKLREQAGRLTGHAIGATVEGKGADLLTDVRKVLAELGQDWVWSKVAAERLAELRPDVYRGWTADTFGAAMKGRGVATKQINRTGPDGLRHNWWGVELGQLPDATGSASTSG